MSRSEPETLGDVKVELVDSGLTMSERGENGSSEKL